MRQRRVLRSIHRASRIGRAGRAAQLLLGAALALALFAGAGLAPVRAQTAWRVSDAPRIVAVGDVHGAYTALVGLLQETGLVDASLHWTGGAAHFVSLGDLLDRGPDARKVLDLLMTLEPQAEAAGGRVHVVLGNHELMNLIGDLRYLTPADYAAFADDETDAMRAAAFAAYRAEQAGQGDVATLQARFDEMYPRGYFARAAAFAPTGRYGAWLLERPAIVVVNGTAFVHGGLPPIVAASSLDTLNRRVQGDIARYLELRAELAGAGLLPAETMERDREAASSALASAGELKPELEEFIALADAPELGNDGPLWYRGSVYCRALVEQPKLEQALAALDADRVVVGHTPTDDRRVRERFGGELVMLDTGMLADYYSGHPAALVLEPGAEYVDYLGTAEHGAIETTAPAEAYGLSDEALVNALEQGEADVQARDAGDPWSVRITHAGKQIGARFYPARRDGAAERELAAAALDALLGTELVPPTVERTIDGTRGALQLRYDDGISEAERLSRRIGLPGTCPLEPQLHLLYMFDMLTMNFGRSAENVFYHHGLALVAAVDFAAAFGTERRLPASFDPATLSLPTALVERLARLDETTLEEQLGDRLGRAEIRALLARRDLLIAGR